MSPHDVDDARLLERIRVIFAESEETYGSPRIHDALKDEGVRVGRKRVARLMRQDGLRARAARIYRRSPGTTRFFVRCPNLVFKLKTTQTNQVLVGDVTYLRAGKQQRYLAAVLDRHSRRVLGWAFGARRDVDLTLRALRAAMATRPPQQGTIFHSDRGVEYTAYSYANCLKDAGMQQSTNRPLRINDNAVMESFWHTLKSEMYHRSVFETDQQLIDALSRFFDRYNTARRHSSLHYKSPIGYELSTAKAA